MTDRLKSTDRPHWLKSLWFHGLGPVLGLVLVSYLLWFYMHGRAFFATSEKVTEAPPVQALPAPEAAAAPSVSEKAPPVSGEKAPSAPAPGLKGQLEQVLAGIREANQKRDLSQLLSYYSPNFPQLTQRTQSISKAWKIYNYPKMEFEIQEITPVNDNIALARVTWVVEAQNISTMKPQTISRTYAITFSRESGQWQISAMETLDKAE